MMVRSSVSIIDKISFSALEILPPIRNKILIYLKV